MCEQCEAQALMWNGEVVPGYRLIQAQKDGMYMKAGWYGLVECNDPDFIFSANPTKEPCADLSDEAWEQISAEMQQAEDDWIDKVHEFEHQLTIDPRYYETGKKADGTPWKSPYVGVDIRTSYQLYRACLKAGYHPHKHGSNVYAWLFHRIAEHMEQEKIVEDVGYINQEKEKNPTAMEGRIHVPPLKRKRRVFLKRFRRNYGKN